MFTVKTNYARPFGDFEREDTAASDIGRQALDAVYTLLNIDEEWTTRRPRSFDWIAHRLRQTIAASEVFRDGKTSLSRLTASCVVVDNVTADDQTLMDFLAILNRHALGSGYAYVPQYRHIKATTCAFVHAETFEWRTSQFGTYAMLQLCVAETEADYIAAMSGGHVAEATHPAGGPRRTPDEMLDMLDGGPFAESGRAASAFIDKWEMDTIEHIARNSSYIATLGSTETGLSLEVAFDVDTALIVIDASKCHRRAGAGLAVRLRLPLELTPQDASRQANALNLTEALGASMATHYGAWSWDLWPSSRQSTCALAYHLFVPNVLHRTGVAQDCAASFVKRARWMDWGLHGVESATDPWKVMSRNFHRLKMEMKAAH
jgi:hypothetical protein